MATRSALFAVLLIYLISNSAWSFAFSSNALSESLGSEELKETPDESKDDDSKQDTDEEKENEEESEETLEDFVEEMTSKSGIFTLYQSDENDELHMEITEEQLDTEFLYFAFVQNGVLEASQIRGFALAQDVIELKKYYNRIEFVKKNTNYYVDPESPLANGGMANISDAVLASAEIKATSKDGKRFLISADGLFQTESLAQITYNPNPNMKPTEQFSVGQLAEDKVKYAYIGVYPQNMNVRTDYVFQNPKPHVWGSARVADARSTTITVQHTFMTMPDNDFVPRRDDQRVGFFGAQVTDLNSFEFTPYRDLISRWHLVKKTPEAEISEPVEPITWWIENTTPLEYREIMKQGILAWNSAFEKAGFKNAIEVKIQPDDATWSAEDVRYNVVRWANTPGAGFAFGPSYINPRTGQIMGGDVMFEHSFLSSYGFTGDVLANPDAFLNSVIDGKESHHHQHHSHGALMHCSKGYEMQEMAKFGQLALTAMNAGVSEKRKIIKQMLTELMLHEVGHALGLSHNMKASNYRSLRDVNRPKVTKGITTASVMDYTALVIAKPNQKQGDFFATKPGPYDDWAIQFGYDPDLEDEKRVAHLAKSTQRELMFGNDADDMRSPGSGIDPRVNIWDMSDDAIGFAQYQFELINEVAPDLKENLAKQGDSFAKLRAATAMMITYKARPTAAIASYIGGVEFNRYLQGQDEDDDLQPYMPVDRAEQKRAMKVLSKFIFAPDAFELPEELITHAAMQRRGFNHWGQNEDPKLLNAVLGVQKVALARLLNPTVMLRMSDTSMYGNEYSVNEMMVDLGKAIFKADYKKSVNAQRRMLQHEFVNQLISLVKGNSHDPIAKSAAFSLLMEIKEELEEREGKDQATKDHRRYLVYLINSALDDD